VIPKRDIGSFSCWEARSAERHGTRKEEHVGALSEFESGQDPGPEGPLTRLIMVIERTARAGWPETVRLIALLAVAAAAVALVIMASR
jgi:hypothetical protein